MLGIEEMCNFARYSENLENVIKQLKGKRVLRLNYDADWQGFVDIDVLLEDGRVFSYEYYYGSCSECDDWENRDLTDKEIEKEMLKECTIFDNEEQYYKWRSKVVD